MSRHLFLVPALALLLLAGSAIANGPLVVVSIHPYYDLARQVAGESAEVVRILPPGASPHTFEPAPSHARLVANADLLVRNGGVGVDDWLRRLIEAGGNDAPVLDIMEALDIDPVEDEHEHRESAEEEHGHGSGDDGATEDREEVHEEEHEEDHTQDSEPRAFLNAHVWLDVTIAIEAVNAIEDALVAVDPANEDDYRRNGTALRTDLEALDRELLQMLAPVRGASFVPFHNAWPYFARRYGLDLVLEIEPFPGREPSPAYLRDVLRAIDESGARAIFAERQLSQRPAQVIADSAGVPVYVLDPEGAADELSYQELMRSNAQVILEALGD